MDPERSQAIVNPKCSIEPKIRSETSEITPMLSLQSNPANIYNQCMTFVKENSASQLKEQTSTMVNHFDGGEALSPQHIDDHFMDGDFGELTPNTLRLIDLQVKELTEYNKEMEIDNSHSRVSPIPFVY